MSKFWEGLGGKLTDQWIATLFTPAFIFWLGGLIAWVVHTGWASLNMLEMQLDHLTSIAQVALLIGSLLVVVVSSSAVQRLDLATLRWLEGYWPRWLRWLGDRCARRKYRKMHEKQERFDQLVAKEKKESLSPKEYSRRVELSLKLRLAPKQPEDYMPTKLGNILRAAEYRPDERYGLVTTICWPRLWLVLPDGTKQEINEARAALNSAARLFLWSLLFLVWLFVFGVWWVPLVAFVSAFWAYRWALSAAETYGDLLESAFDLHRFALYEALRFPLPMNTLTEKERGEQLTKYLFYGRLATLVTFQKPSDTKQE